MAYSDRYDQYRDRDRDRDMDRSRDRWGQREARLDDRTGMEPGSPGGYRSRSDEDRDYGRAGHREQNYNQRSGEGRTFGNDYSSGYAGGRTGYGGPGGQNTDVGMRGARYGGERHFGRESQGYETYPFNPYQEYASPTGSYGRGYGGGGGGGARERDRSLETYRGQDYTAGPDLTLGQDPSFPVGQARYGQDRGRGGTYEYRADERWGGQQGAHGREHERYGERDEGRGFWDKAADKVSSWFGGEEGRAAETYGGQHRGRGPKGYRRSDERIREDVSDRLTDDPWLDASSIEVQVNNGDVTLTGTVRTRDDKRRAENIAETVSGVDNVQNTLRVERAQDWRSDTSTGAQTMSGRAVGSNGDDGGASLTGSQNTSTQTPAGGRNDKLGGVSQGKA